MYNVFSSCTKQCPNGRYLNANISQLRNNKRAVVSAKKSQYLSTCLHNTNKYSSVLAAEYFQTMDADYFESVGAPTPHPNVRTPRFMINELESRFLKCIGCLVYLFV